MSKDASLLFFGVRFEITPSQVASAENRSLPIVQKARALGLQFYWEDFGVELPRYYGFVGKRLAILGVENDAEVIVTAAELESHVKTVTEKLRNAGIDEPPALYAHWMPSKG